MRQNDDKSYTLPGEEVLGYKDTNHFINSQQQQTHVRMLTSEVDDQT